MTKIILYITLSFAVLGSILSYTAYADEIRGAMFCNTVTQVCSLDAGVLYK